MRATEIRKKGPASFEETKPAGQILILHEDFRAYSRAVDICRKIMERSGDSLDFDIKCWSFVELADPNCARHAAKTAGGADVVLISMLTTQLPIEVDRWLDFFFISRFQTDGVLMLALEDSTGTASAKEQLASRLEQIAKKLKMDFVSLPGGNDRAVLDVHPIAIPVPRNNGRSRLL